jgi:uncharacterized protein YacL
LTGTQQMASEAEIVTSQSVAPGRYMLAVGFEAGSVRVWTFIQTQVVAQAELTQIIASNLWLVIGVIVAVLVAVFVVKRGIRGSSRREIGLR